MKSTKRYTTQTFTHRVDHEKGAHRSERKLPEPTVCRECSAVYRGGRWAFTRIPFDGEAHSGLCPACRQSAEKITGGYVSVGGLFYNQHRLEIEDLIRNEAYHELEDNPLSRIMKWDDGSQLLKVETTTEHLAQRLGHALKKAYDGEVSYDFSHENKLARVAWTRD